MADVQSTVARLPIPDFPGYEVDDYGGVWSCRPCKHAENKKWKRLKISKLPKGYCFVQLRRDGKYHMRYVHRLVLEAFVGPCPEGQECRHGNNDRGDNRLENICWGTKLENAKDKERHGTVNRGERNGGARVTADVVLSIRQLHASGEFTTVDIADMSGLSQTQVWKIVTRRKWKHI